MSYEKRSTINIEGMPNGWTAEYIEHRGYDSPDREIVAKHPDFPSARIGVGSKIRDEDRAALLVQISRSMSPNISHAQWSHLGREKGWDLELLSRVKRIEDLKDDQIKKNSKIFDKFKRVVFITPVGYTLTDTIFVALNHLSSFDDEKVLISHGGLELEAQRGDTVESLCEKYDEKYEEISCK